MFPAEATVPIPPPDLQIQVGPPGVFVDVALTTMGRLNMAGLRPDHDVLDIGCGVGRTARYLCDYLDSDARYVGFDIAENLIRWCQANITPHFPNFTFEFVPVFNSYYLPDRSFPSAAELRFPYPDTSFDFVFAHSVFTHLPPDASDNYLAEVRRVLKPGGLSYTTWFLFEDDPSTALGSLVPSMRLDDSGDFAVANPEIPDAAVAYREKYVLDLYRAHNLQIIEPVHPGFGKLQDAIVATGS